MGRGGEVGYTEGGRGWEGVIECISAAFPVCEWWRLYQSDGVKIVVFYRRSFSTSILEA